MIVGIGALLVALFHAVGGPAEGLRQLAALPPTEGADNGFLALSSGAGGLNIVFLAVVTSVGIWAQPQLIQRHFALRSQEETRKAGAPLAMLAAFRWSSEERTSQAPSHASCSAAASRTRTRCSPYSSTNFSPRRGSSFFALAIVSASLSTASALLHIASGSLGRDVLKCELHGWPWRITVIFCALGSGPLRA